MCLMRTAIQGLWARIMRKPKGRLRVCRSASPGCDAQESRALSGSRLRFCAYTLGKARHTALYSKQTVVNSGSGTCSSLTRMRKATALEVQRVLHFNPLCVIPSHAS